MTEYTWLCAGAKENKSSAQNEKKALKRFYEESAKLNPTEKFLWEYIQNDGWTDQEDKKAGLVDEDSEQEDKATCNHLLQPPAAC